MNKTIQKIGVGISTAAIAVMSFAMPVLAADTVVTPSNTAGWTQADTRIGGAVNFVSDNEAPAGSGALQLTTDSTTTAKAQYMHPAAADTLLANVTELGYYTKQNSSSFEGGAASYQIPVLLNGTTGFTTLVYEPYQNGNVETNVWQSWDVSQGQFWSSKTVTCSNGGVVAGGGGAPFYTLSDIQTMCPEAIVLGYGVNIGSNNPSYDVEVDLVNFNGAIYDFELFNTPKSMEQCKNNGWKDLTDSNGKAFMNQGQCVSYFVNK